MITHRNSSGFTSVHDVKSRVAAIVPCSLTADDIRQELGRILDSDLFTRAERLSSFLRYVVDQALKGNGTELKECSIALAVFGRPELFDNRVDPIVRVEARRLRAKLREYYATVGRDDPVWIGLRNRGYEPVFEEQRRSVRLSAFKVENADASLPRENEAIKVKNGTFRNVGQEELIAHEQALLRRESP